MNAGYIAGVQKFPPLGNLQFQTEDDFKAYWLTSHGFVPPLPSICGWTQSRPHDLLGFLSRL